MNDIEEVRVVTANGVVHRAFRNDRGILWTVESDNVDDSERIIVTRSSPDEPFRFPDEPAAHRICERCL